MAPRRRPGGAMHPIYTDLPADHFLADPALFTRMENVNRWGVDWRAVVTLAPEQIGRILAPQAAALRKIVTADPMAPVPNSGRFNLYWRGAEGRTVLRTVDGFTKGAQVEGLPLSLPEDIRLGSAESSEQFWNVSGALWDMGRLMSGEPECALDFRNDLSKNRVIRVCVEASFNGGLGNEILNKRARAVSALLTALNAQGYECEIVWVSTQHASGGPYRGQPTLIETVVHSPGFAMEAGRLAWTLADPNAQRLIMYAIECATLPCESGSVCYAEMEEMKRYCEARGWIYLPSDFQEMREAFGTDAATVEWLRARIADAHRPEGMGTETRDGHEGL